MTFKIITADERLKEDNAKITAAIFGKPGVGKTSLLYTLDASSTLALDFEGGMLAVQNWKGDSIPLRTYQDAMDVACLIGGSNPAMRPQDPFSQDHYDHVKKVYPDINMNNYRTIFFDSISDLSHVAFQYAKTQPSAYNSKGVEDVRGAYGELGRQVVTLLKHLQHAPSKNVIFVGRLERVTDDFNREVFQPQMVGGMISREITGIIDEAISMSLFDYDAATGWKHNFDRGAHRGFVCQTNNPFGLPAKDRSGNLDLIEEPHLGHLMEKIAQRNKGDKPMQFGTPAVVAEKTA